MHGQSSNLYQAFGTVGLSCRQMAVCLGMASSWLSDHGQAHQCDNQRSHFYSYLNMWIFPFLTFFVISANFLNDKHQVTELSISGSIRATCKNEQETWKEEKLWGLGNKEEKENRNVNSPVINGCLPGWLLCGMSPPWYLPQTPAGLPNSLPQSPLHEGEDKVETTK